MTDIFANLMFLLGWAALGVAVCLGVALIVALVILAARDA